MSVEARPFGISISLHQIPDRAALTFCNAQSSKDQQDQVTYADVGASLTLK